MPLFCALPRLPAAFGAVCRPDPPPRPAPAGAMRFRYRSVMFNAVLHIENNFVILSHYPWDSDILSLVKVFR